MAGTAAIRSQKLQCFFYGPLKSLPHRNKQVHKILVAVFVRKNGSFRAPAVIGQIVFPHLLGDFYMKFLLNAA